MTERRRHMGGKATPPNYLRFTALEDGTFTLTIPSQVTTSYVSWIEYSTDEGATWVRTNNSSSAVTITTPTVTTGNSVLWRGSGSNMTNRSNTSTSGLENFTSTFSSTGQFNVSGIILSLLYYNSFWNRLLETPNQGCYRHLFYGCTRLIDASELILPQTVSTYIYWQTFGACSSLIATPELTATTMASYCYSYMFVGCSSLAVAPELPAESLASYCYQYMFRMCTSLVTAPELPAMTLYDSCYYFMFDGCTGLTIPPELPSETLANACYCYMFRDCTSLITAPELPATTLAVSCYNNMFNGCTSLINPPALPATNLTDSCYRYMFQNCTSLTTGPELPATSIKNYSYYGMFRDCTNLTSAPELPGTSFLTGAYEEMFYGCTKLTSAPELPAETLSTECYYRMFYGCTSLTAAPVLPATTLADSCYREMFRNCSKLNFIKCLATSFGSSSLYYWVNGVSSSGYFVKDPNATWATGASGIPSGWMQMDIGSYYVSSNSIAAVKDAIIEHIDAVIDVDHYVITNNNQWYSVSTNAAGSFIDIVVNITENSTGSDRSGAFTLSFYDSNNTLLDTTTISVTQMAVSAYYTVNLNDGAWVWDSALNCYKSDSNYHVSNGSAKMSIDIFGYSEFTIKVRTNGEKNYDYLTVGKLDQIPTKSSSTSGVNYWTGYGKASATTWYDVTFSNIDGGNHTINLLYAKDSSGNSNEDRGFVQIITE